VQFRLCTGRYGDGVVRAVLNAASGTKLKVAADPVWRRLTWTRLLPNVRESTNLRSLDPQRRQKQTLQTTPALPSRDDIRTCCSMLFQWNTSFLAPIVGKTFRWFSTSPFVVKSISKTAKSAATQSRSRRCAPASTPRYSNRFVLDRIHGRGTAWKTGCHVTPKSEQLR
jgi:hypothetical protein